MATSFSLVSVAETPRRMGQAKRNPANYARKHDGTALRLSHPTSHNRDSLTCRRLCSAFCLAVSMAACFAVPPKSWAGEQTREEPNKPETPQEMFRSLGVDDSFFDRLADGGPLDAPETESLLRVLFRLRIFPAVDLQRWAIEPDKLAETISQPDLARGQIFRLRGRVTEVEPCKPDGDAAQRYEMPRYFRCRLQLDASDQTADIYTENVPVEWQEGAQPNASAGALGVFLKLDEKAEDPPLLVFAAPRLAWYPDNLLGQLGMDVGLLDTVQNQKPIVAEDREAFYQMLAAAGRAKPGQLLRQAEEDLPKTPDDWRWTNRQNEIQYSVVPLFNEAATQQGRLVELLGAARRVEEIHLDKVQDADIIARFGFDHYYQVALFTDESQGNPLWFCVLELPEGMPYGNLPHYGETVRIAGFFFKTWSYAVPKLADPSLTAGDPKTHRQLAPLLIGRSLTWYRVSKPADNAFSGTVVGGLLLLVMVVVWLAAWQTRRRERKWLDKMESPPKLDSGIDLEQVGPRTEAAPDFSHVAEMDHGPEYGKKA
jgi:hypothetical protein